MDARSRILKVARQHFFTLGFSKVTMDEIAREVGMSKRTLYQHFPGKKALLERALIGKTETIARGLERILAGAHTGFPEKLKAALGLVASEMPAFSHIFLRDIQRHAPEIWEELDRQRQRVIRDQFGRLIGEGVREGFLKEGVDAQLLILLFATLARHILNPETLPTLPLTAPEAFKAISGVVFEGILSEEGRAKLRGMEP